MSKKYQVFISSTYIDLKEERAAATQILLDNNCIPVGMEQFPASNMSQMAYIEKMLNDCDYYVLILGGRYGSTDQDDVGFTEKEYDYAVTKGIPIMSFVFESPEMLPFSKLDPTDDLRAKFNKFREKVCSNKLVKYYSNIGTLQANIATSIHKCIRDFPAVGWVRGDSVEDTNKGNIQQLEAKISELEQKQKESLRLKEMPENMSYSDMEEGILYYTSN